MTVTAPVATLSELEPVAGWPGAATEHSGCVPRHVPSTWHTIGLPPFASGCAKAAQAT